MDGTRLAVASEEVRTVLAHLGREFKTPLQSLRAGLDAIATDPARPASVIDHAETMAVVCEDLIAVTDSFFEFLWLTRDDRPVCPAPLRLSRLAEQVDRRYRTIAGGHAWDVRLEGPDPEVEADLSLCLAMLDPLVENAVRYTPAPGAIVVTFSSHRDGWRMAIRDDGPGIPEAERDRVLEPFARLSREVDSAAPGSGLGLAFCRRLADRVGATIAVDASPGGGNLITLAFPGGPSVGR